jgi:hypothetical protein
MIRRRASRTDGYVSEFTAFMDDFLARHPEVVQARERNRRELWDVEVDFDELARARADSVPFPAYPYWNAPPRPQPPQVARGPAVAPQRMTAAANDERESSARAA